MSWPKLTVTLRAARPPAVQQQQPKHHHQRPTRRNLHHQTVHCASSAKRQVYSWEEARRKARSLGFQSKEEFEEYDCPGAYGLPRSPHEAYAHDWEGWGDFLGTMHGYETARGRARELGCRAGGAEGWREAGYGGTEEWFDARVPVRPDLFYKREWEGWDEWLGLEGRLSSSSPDE